jgi:hypothetical protein
VLEILNSTDQKYDRYFELTASRVWLTSAISTHQSLTVISPSHIPSEKERDIVFRDEDVRTSTEWTCFKAYRR